MSRSIVVEHVSKRFTMQYSRTIKQMSIAALRGQQLRDTFLAVDDVSFTVEQGESIGLMGLNGSGKSTLLKLISGVMQPDSGTVHLRGRVAGLIDAGAGMHPELTCRENIHLNAGILGMTRAEVASRFDAIIDFSGIPEKLLDTQVRFLSSGMFSRLGFSIAIHAEPDVFLVDEVLAVGDGPFKQKCRKALLAQRKHPGMTLIIVAHEIGLLRRLCTESLVLDAGQVVYRGPLSGAEALLGDEYGAEELSGLGDLADSAL